MARYSKDDPDDPHAYCDSSDARSLRPTRQNNDCEEVARWSPRQSRYGQEVGRGVTPSAPLAVAKVVTVTPWRIRPSRAAVRRALDLRAGGASYRVIATTLDAEGTEAAPRCIVVCDECALCGAAL
ncbi:MAG: hypothetical protein V9E85_14400 [Candidatus Nanopelagicales bacterium]